MTFISVPLNVLINRSIVTPHLLPWSPKAAAALVLTPYERARPWVMFKSPGLLAATTLQVLWVTVVATSVRALVVEELANGIFKDPSSSRDGPFARIRTGRLFIFLAFQAASTLILCVPALRAPAAARLLSADPAALPEPGARSRCSPSASRSSARTRLARSRRARSRASTPPRTRTSLASGARRSRTPASLCVLLRTPRRLSSPKTRADRHALLSHPHRTRSSRSTPRRASARSTLPGSSPCSARSWAPSCRAGPTAPRPSPPARSPRPQRHGRAMQRPCSRPKLPQPRPRLLCSSRALRLPPKSQLRNAPPPKKLLYSSSPLLPTLSHAAIFPPETGPFARGSVVMRSMYGRAGAGRRPAKEPLGRASSPPWPALGARAAAGSRTRGGRTRAQSSYFGSTGRRGLSGAAREGEARPGNAASARRHAGH